MRRATIPVLLFGCLLMTTQAAAGALRLPALFSDHVVLQRERPVRLWGWAAPGARLHIALAGAELETRAGADGRWEVLWPPQAAGGPHRLVVRSGSERLEIEDVWFGDVWLAGGQSNMEWKLGFGVEGLEAALARADRPLIRFFEVPDRIAHRPAADLEGGAWQLADPERAKSFSAVAWFFAERNHLEEGVPVGVIDSAWGGTPAEAWVNVLRLRALPGYRAKAEAVLAEPDWPRRIAENAAREAEKWQRLDDAAAALEQGVARSDYDDAAWDEVSLPNTRPLHDFVWLRRRVRLERVPAAARLSLGRLAQEAQVYVNGRLVGRADWTTEVPSWPIPDGLLEPGDNLIALRVANSWNNEVWIGGPDGMRLYGDGVDVSLAGAWRVSTTVEPPMPQVERLNWTPGFLYNGMIAPIAGFTLRGALWYQGESNTDRAADYAPLFQMLIHDWRIAWRQGDLPFLFVQLAAWDDRNPAADWPGLRAAQAAALALPATGMAVALDLGDPKDIHPRNKAPVGERLWRVARKVVWADPDVVAEGPAPQALTRHGRVLRLRLDPKARKLVFRGGPPCGFEIAGPDGVFHPAAARPVDARTLELAAKAVAEPVALRYAWAAAPDCANLYNDAGLPAAPFALSLETDDQR